MFFKLRLYFYMVFYRFLNTIVNHRSIETLKSTDEIFFIGELYKIDVIRLFFILHAFFKPRSYWQDFTVDNTGDNY